MQFRAKALIISTAFLVPLLVSLFFQWQAAQESIQFAESEKRGIHYARPLIDLIQEEGRTLLLTSHVLTDVERVADRVVLLDRGAVRVDAPLDDVRRLVRRYELVHAGVPPETLDPIAGLVRARRRQGRWTVTVRGDEADVRAALGASGAEVAAVEPLSLEDVFVEYTSREEVAS